MAQKSEDSPIRHVRFHHLLQVQTPDEAGANTLENEEDEEEEMIEIICESEKEERDFSERLSIHE